MAILTNSSSVELIRPAPEPMGFILTNSTPIPTQPDRVVVSIAFAVGEPHKRLERLLDTFSTDAVPCAATTRCFSPTRKTSLPQQRENKQSSCAKILWTP